jgi:hypothetical protein
VRFFTLRNAAASSMVKIVMRADSRRPIQDTWYVKVNRLPIVTAPHDGWILYEPTAMKAAMPDGRELEGILVISDMGRVRLIRSPIPANAATKKRPRLHTGHSPCSSAVRPCPLFQLHGIEPSERKGALAVQARSRRARPSNSNPPYSANGRSSRCSEGVEAVGMETMKDIKNRIREGIIQHPGVIQTEKGIEPYTLFPAPSTRDSFRSRPIEPLEPLRPLDSRGRRDRLDDPFGDPLTRSLLLGE